ncbi:MAG: hypothetical protein MJ208_02280, partial [Bacilli bacterium]|nr:hypothetical protein [Bacilli bacterium]
MDIKKISYHGHQFFTVKNNVGLEITFCSYGASIYNIKYHNKTVTYHPGSFESFLNNNKFYGKLLGRICGRIKDGVIKVDKKIYHLDKNEGNNTLHGGKKCLSFQDFEPFFSESEELINIVFKYTSVDLECGFPGSVRFVIVYNIMKNKNKFSINFHAVPQQATPLNLSTHIYWRLLDKDVLDHRLTINANEITKFDDQLIVCGKMHASKIYNFREEKR